ncbi:prenyltransferase [Sinomonas halotolerans]|uniref:Prenyltransferase n=1 Tax=Sinomonas halotolerans TaxID=1644133 RepID=A0ABU9X2R9_9MICC
MTYLALDLAFLAAAGGIAVVLAASRKARRPATMPLLAAAAALLVLTAVFDNLMIAAGLFSYAPESLTGTAVGLAPVEDFGYPLAAAVLVPALWTRLRGREGFLRALLVSSRPVSWVNTAYPFAAAYLLAGGGVDWRLAVGTLFFLVPYNLAMYGTNDVFDYASDVLNPRKGGAEGAVLPPPLHRPALWAAWGGCVPFVALLVLGGGPASWAVLAVSLFAVAAYSVPGLRFKERAVLDSATSSTHFVSPAVYGLALAGTGLTPAAVAILGAFFLWGMASHAFGAVQDIGPDREAGIGSVATLVGARATVRSAVLGYLAAGALVAASGFMPGAAFMGTGEPMPVGASTAAAAGAGTGPAPGLLAGLLALPYAVNAAVFWGVTDDDAARTRAGWRRFLWLNYATGFAVTLLLIWIWMEQ